MIINTVAKKLYVYRINAAMNDRHIAQIMFEASADHLILFSDYVELEELADTLTKKEWRKQPWV